MNWSDLTAEIGAIAFVIAAFYLLFLPRSERFSRRAWLAWGVVGLFLLALAWSMWSETLRPLLHAGETERAIRTALGLAGIGLAVLVLVYGGFGVVSAILRTMGDETLEQNIFIIRRRKQFPPGVTHTARWANLTALLRAVRPGCLWMLLGFLLLALGGWLQQ